MEATKITIEGQTEAIKAKIAALTDDQLILAAIAKDQDEIDAGAAEFAQAVGDYIQAMIELGAGDVDEFGFMILSYISAELATRYSKTLNK